MSHEEFPNEVDIIILGTSLTSTIVAAAFSRIGLKVLHLDRKDYYGGHFGNFNLDGIVAWKKKQDELNTTSKKNEHDCPVKENITQSLPDGMICVELPKECPHAFNLSVQYHVRKRTPEEEADTKSSSFPLASKSFKTSEVIPRQDNTLSIENPNNNEDSMHVEGNDNNVKDETKKIRNEEENSSADVNELSNEDDSGVVQDHETKGLNESSSCCNEAENMSKDKLNSFEKQNVLDEIYCDSKHDTGDQIDTDCVAAHKVSFENTEKKEEIVSQGQGANSSNQDAMKKKEWTVGDIQDGGRRFCFDVSPKLLHCCGDIVKLLVRSDVARYCEFRSVNRVLTVLQDTLVEVPCTRASLFSSKIVSLIEKRLMMKFLQFAADHENLEEYERVKNTSFTEFLKCKKLTSNLQHFVQHAIAMVPDTSTVEEGLKKTKKFLSSLGLYSSDGAFLFPMYGTGELAQAFSRLSAVFGGIYCLTETASHILSDSESKCHGVILSSGQTVHCKYLIAEASYLPTHHFERISQGKISRGIYVTNASIHSSTEDPLTILNFICKDDSARPVTMLELPASACVCPKDLYVVYLTRPTDCDNPEEDLKEAEKRLFFNDETQDSQCPHVLWSMHFTLHDWSRVRLTDQAISSVLVTSEGGDAGIDVDFCVEEARQLFHTVCPDEEFLPTPPNPEDIIRDCADDGGGSSDKDKENSNDKTEIVEANSEENTEQSEGGLQLVEGGKNDVTENGKEEITEQIVQEL